MSEFQDWAAAMCGVGIGCTLLSTLCPVGRMRRVFSVLTAVFFLCCLLVPLKTLVGTASDLFALPEGSAVSQGLTKEIDEQTTAILEQALFEDAVSRLGDAVTVKKTAVCRDNSRTDSIYIERVRVTLDRGDKGSAPSVRTTLEKAWGVPVEVYYVG